MEEDAPVIARFLAAVADRDAAAVAACFTPDGSYATCVPHPPYRGRDQIATMFERAFAGAERVVWDVVDRAEAPGAVWLERIDRFWYRGTEVAIECLGVFVLSTDGTSIAEVRDYVDLATFRERRAAVDG